MLPIEPNDQDCLEEDLPNVEVIDYYLDIVEIQDFEDGMVEKAFSDAKMNVLFDPLEVEDRREVLLVSRVLPGDGQIYILDGSNDAISGIEIS